MFLDSLPLLWKEYANSWVIELGLSQVFGFRSAKAPGQIRCLSLCLWFVPNWVECDSYQMVLWFEACIALHGFAFCSKSDCLGLSFPLVSAHPRSPWKEPYGLQAVEVIALSKIVKDLIGTGVDSSDRGHPCRQIMWDWWTDVNWCQLMRALLVDVCLFVEAFLKSDGRYNQFWKLRWTLACSVQLYIDSAEGFAQSRRPSQCKNELLSAAVTIRLSSLDLWYMTGGIVRTCTNLSTQFKSNS